MGLRQLFQKREEGKRKVFFDESDWSNSEAPDTLPDETEEQRFQKEVFRCNRTRLFLRWILDLKK